MCVCACTHTHTTFTPLGTCAPHPLTTLPVHTQTSPHPLGIHTHLLVPTHISYTHTHTHTDNFLHVFGTMHNEDSANQTDTPVQLFDVLQSHPPCNDFSQGVSCCLSTHCIFTQVKSHTAVDAGDPVNIVSFIMPMSVDLGLVNSCSTWPYSWLL